jgi:hypothetical protein
VFGICGEFPVFRGSLRFLGEYLWGLEDDKGEKKTGKAWTKRGEHMVETWWERGCSLWCLGERVWRAVVAAPALASGDPDLRLPPEVVHIDK